MDLTPTPRQRAFREEVRRWLGENAPREPLAPMLTPEGRAAHREWEGALARAGYAALHWPAEHGGGGADLQTQAIFQEEYIAAQAPTRLNRMGLGLLGPTLIALGSAAQRERFLPSILSCEHIWCQGFSEPDAGSDLAAVRTTGRVDDDEIVLNGQKTWTSLAVIADWMFALVRTEPGSERHRGLSFVLVPMDAPGLTMRPLRQLHGEDGFAEVFFDDVTIPRDNVVGELGDGWAVAMTTLGFERGTGLGDHVRFTRDVEDLAVLARTTSRAGDPSVRREIARRHVEALAFRAYMLNALARLQRNDPGLSPSVTKLSWSELEVRIFTTVRETLGEFAELAEPADGVPAGPGLQRRYWHARAARIFAGTNEVQRNIIAERVLGLPKEPK